MTTTGSSPDPKPRTIYSAQPIRWPHLDDEKTAEQLGELTDWVLWLTWRFNLDHRTVPHCWNRHGAVIEELSDPQARSSGVRSVTTHQVASHPNRPS